MRRATASIFYSLKFNINVRSICHKNFDTCQYYYKFLLSHTINVGVLSAAIKRERGRQAGMQTGSKWSGFVRLRNFGLYSLECCAPNIKIVFASVIVHRI